VSLLRLGESRNRDKYGEAEDRRKSKNKVRGHVRRLKPLSAGWGHAVLFVGTLVCHTACLVETVDVRRAMARPKVAPHAAGARQLQGTTCEDSVQGTDDNPFEDHAGMLRRPRQQRVENHEKERQKDEGDNASSLRKTDSHNHGERPQPAEPPPSPPNHMPHEQLDEQADRQDQRPRTNPISGMVATLKTTDSVVAPLSPKLGTVGVLPMLDYFGVVLRRGFQPQHRQPRLLEMRTRAPKAQTDQLNHSTSADRGLSWPVMSLVATTAM